MAYVEKNRGGWLDWQDPDIRHMEEVSFAVVTVLVLFMVLGAIYLM